MRRRFLAVSAALSLLVIAACGPDVVSPKDGQVPGKGPQLVVTAGATCDPAYDAAAVTADLGTLMGVLTPNNNSAQSKWSYVKLLMSYNNPDSTLKAQEYAQSPLISFITLKYNQASTATKAQYADLFAKVTAGITCFVAFDIPTTNDPVALANEDGSGGAWFPPGFCDADCGGINVKFEKVQKCDSPTVPNVPLGCISNPLNTLLDQYGQYMKITTTGGTPNFNLPVVVALCFPPGAPEDVLVGHQETNVPGANGFAVLDKTDIPPALDDLLVCDDIAQANAPTNVFARFVRGVANLLLPERLSARSYYMATLGVGGTTRKFSSFGLVSPTLSATGGIGGSKSSFSPANPDAPATSGPAMVMLADGTLEDLANVVQTTNLPTVLVRTKLGTPIPLATVKFAVQDPKLTDPNYAGKPSKAAVCRMVSGTAVEVDTVRVETNSDGYAQLNCLDFGNDSGYMDLSATIDPTTAPGLSEDGGIDNVVATACEEGATATAPLVCDPANADGTATLHWLVKTVTGPPANLTVTTPGGEAGGAQLGLALNKQPVATVLDASNKPVGNVTVTVGLTVGGGILGCYTGTTCTSATTDAFGKATFSNLVITGLVADVEQTLTFTSGALTATAKVTPTVGVAKNLAVVTPLPVAGQLGEALDPQPKVKVTDTWDNAVSGATVTVTLTAGGGILGCVSPATGCETAPLTAVDGTTTFSALMITGKVAGVEQTLTFASAGTTDQPATVTPSAGDAKNLTVETAPVAGQLGKALTTQPIVKVTDEWTNAVSGATVTVDLTAGGGDLGCFSGSGCKTAPLTAADGTATFSSLMITGLVAGVEQTLTFSSTTTNSPFAKVTPSAGDATTIIANSPSGGTYGSFAPFTAVSPNPEVKVTDAYGNPIASAGIVWQLASALTGASLSSTTSNTSAAGLSSVTWTLGDGGNGLTAVLGANSGLSAAFTATSGTGVTLAACTLSGTTKKTDLAKFSSTGYKGYFSILSSGKGMIRSVEMRMSVTGQSSGTGNYVTTLRAYRKNTTGTRGDLIATFKPSTSDKTLKLPGNNSTPSLIPFGLEGNTGLATSPEMLIFELEITAPSTRTFQIWYNTKTTAGDPCATSKLYTPGAVTDAATFNFGSSTSFLAGHALKITN